MKKLLILSFALCACNNTIDIKSGADKLTRLNAEPTNCIYLYQLETDANFYSESDAIKYVENRIASAEGNTYWFKSKEKKQNKWKPFAPEYFYQIVALVYNCPLFVSR
jgi:hypothetical protein